MPPSRVKIVRQVNESNYCPCVLHCMVTSHCDLNCSGCFYRVAQSSELTEAQALSVVDQAIALDVKDLAIGGGEPTQWPHLVNMLEYARDRKLHTTVTTNGFNLIKIRPTAVHISCDRRHAAGFRCSDAEYFDRIRDSLIHYWGLGLQIGINVTTSDIEWLDPEVVELAGSVVVVLDKPVSLTPGYGKIIKARLARLESDKLLVSIDSCLFALLYGACSQGRISYAMDARGRFSVCSNIAEAHRTAPGLTLESGWAQVRNFKQSFASGCMLTGEDMVRFRDEYFG